MGNGIEKAVHLAGSQTALAVGLSIKPQAVQKWVEQGFVPSKRCIAVEEFLGGAVTRYELNPQVFGTSARGTRVRKSPVVEGRVIDGAIVREAVNGLRIPKTDTRKLRE